MELRLRAGSHDANRVSAQCIADIRAARSVAACRKKAESYLADGRIDGCCWPQTFLIRMTQLMPQTRFSEFEKTSTVSLSGTGTFATVCKVLTRIWQDCYALITIPGSRHSQPMERMDSL